MAGNIGGNCNDENVPAQRPCRHRSPIRSRAAASGRIAANQLKTLTHRWRWKDYRPFLDLEPDSRFLYRLGRE